MSDDGLVDPSGIPQLDSGTIRDVAAAMTKIAAAVTEQTGTAQTSWGSLSSYLSGPGLDVLYTALAGPCQKLDGVADRMYQAASALNTFAEAMDQVRPGMNQARDDAQAFVDQVSGGVWLDVWDTTLITHYWGPPPWEDPVKYWESKGYQARKPHWWSDVQVKVAWTQSENLVNQNNDLVSRVNALYATLEDAEADCANTLNSLVTGSCMASVEKYSAQDLDAYTASGQSMPWGSQPYGDPNCFESAGMGAVDFGKGMADGITALFGRDPTTGQWSWDEAGTAWLGMGETLGSLVLSTMPFAPELATLPGSVGDVFRAANEKTTDLLKGLVDYDMWGKDPVRAGTDTLLNIGTFFLPGAGEVAGGIKTSLEAVSATAKAADAAKLAAIAAGGAKVAGVAEHIFNLPGAIAGKALGSIVTRFKYANLTIDDLNDAALATERQTIEAGEHANTTITAHADADVTDGVTQTAIRSTDDTIRGADDTARAAADTIGAGARRADSTLDEQVARRDVDDATQTARSDLDDGAATAARRTDDTDQPAASERASDTDSSVKPHDDTPTAKSDDATKPDEPVVKHDDDAQPGDPAAKPDDAAKHDADAAKTTDDTSTPTDDTAAKPPSKFAGLQHLADDLRVNPLQRAELQRVINDPSLLHSTAQKGNFAEMVGDAIMARDGFERLGPDMVTSIDQAGHTGIDGIYYKDTPDGPQYQIVDQKYATDGHWHLGHVVSGDTQLSPNWIYDRLQKYFDPHRTGLSPTDQAHLDTLNSHFEQLTHSPTTRPTGADVSVHVQGMDSAGKVTDTTMKNTDAASTIARSHSKTAIPNNLPKDQS